MDLVAACRALVAVSARGSFTVGAAEAGVPQPVASRRIAALEELLGARLLDRSTRAVVPTAFGRDVLPAARRLVEVADALLHRAGSALSRPLDLALPATCPQEALVRLVAEAAEQDLTLQLHCTGPGERAQLALTRDVQVAVLAVPADDATWRVPLGVASGGPAPSDVLHLDTLRSGRWPEGEAVRTLWLQPEDEVPQVRDRLISLGNAVGLQPGQIAVAGSVVAAAARVLTSQDLLLCSAGQARELHLPWARLGGECPYRGYRLTGADHEDVARVGALVGTAIAACLGAADDGPGGSTSPRSAGSVGTGREDVDR